MIETISSLDLNSIELLADVETLPVITPKMIRQGDVLFVPIPAEEFTASLQAGTYVDSGIIARGLHTHRIEKNDLQNAVLVSASDRDTNWAPRPRFVEAKQTVRVIHEEHNTVFLLPGHYRINIAREFDPIARFARSVVD